MTKNERRIAALWKDFEKSGSVEEYLRYRKSMAKIRRENS